MYIQGRQAQKILNLLFDSNNFLLGWLQIYPTKLIFLELSC